VRKDLADVDAALPVPAEAIRRGEGGAGAAARVRRFAVGSNLTA